MIDELPDIYELLGFTSKYEVDFEFLLELISSGQLTEALRYLGSIIISNSFQTEILNKEMFARLAVTSICIMICSLLMNTVNVNFAEDITQLFMRVIFCLIINGFVIISVNICSNTLAELIDFSRISLPAFAMAMAGSGRSYSAITFYEIMLLVINLISKLTKSVLIPLISVYFYVVMMNFVAGKSIFSSLEKLLLEIANWINKGAVTVVLAINTLTGIITPSLDSTGQKAIGKAIGMLPGIGDISDGISGIVISGANVLKNTLGVGIMLIVVMVIVIPVIRVLMCGVGIKIMAAMLEPGFIFGSYTDVMEKTAAGLFATVRTLLGTELILFISIAVMCIATNGGT